MRSRKREFVKSYDIFNSIMESGLRYQEVDDAQATRNRPATSVKILTKEETRALLNLPAAKYLR